MENAFPQLFYTNETHESWIQAIIVEIYKIHPYEKVANFLEKKEEHYILEAWKYITYYLST